MTEHGPMSEDPRQAGLPMGMRGLFALTAGTLIFAVIVFALLYELPGILT